MKIHLPRRFWAPSVLSSAARQQPGRPDGLPLQFKRAFMKPRLALLISPWWAKDNNDDVTEHLGSYVIPLLRNLLVRESFWHPLVTLKRPNEASPGRAKPNVWQARAGAIASSPKLSTQSPACSWARLQNELVAADVPSPLRRTLCAGSERTWGADLPGSVRLLCAARGCGAGRAVLVPLACS